MQQPEAKEGRLLNALAMSIDTAIAFLSLGLVSCPDRGRWSWNGSAEHPPLAPIPNGRHIVLSVPVVFDRVGHRRGPTDVPALGLNREVWLDFLDLYP